MRLCFIVEERYRRDSMPLAVARQLGDWGHEIDVFEPQAELAAISELCAAGARYDAWVLKTVSDGPGLSVLEAAAAAGMRTINDARSIRPVRDKAVAASVARREGLPFPLTYFAALPELLHQVSADLYPLVVKPANGSACRGVHLVRTPMDLDRILPALQALGFLLAQPYLPNKGVDMKVYCTGDATFATVQRSPLHPDVPGTGRLVSIPDEVHALVRRVGRVFGLDLFGVDLLETADGWMVVDVNDFPSFTFIPGAVMRVAETILRLAGEAPSDGARWGQPSVRTSRRSGGAVTAGAIRSSVATAAAERLVEAASP